MRFARSVKSRTVVPEHFTGEGEGGLLLLRTCIFHSPLFMERDGRIKYPNIRYIILCLTTCCLFMMLGMLCWGCLPRWMAMKERNKQTNKKEKSL